MFCNPVSSLGEIYLKTVSPSHCSATGEALEKAVVDKEAAVLVHTIDNRGKKCDETNTVVTGELVSSVTMEIGQV